MAGNVVVLSAGSNHSWLPKDQLQAQIERSIQAIRARQPDAQIVMVNPVKNFTWGFPSGTSSTTPYDAVTGAARKYGIQTVDFTPSEDNIHPADTQALVDKIQSITNTPAQEWTPVGDSIAEMIAQTAGATTDFTKKSMTPQYIFENFASKIPSTVDDSVQVEKAAPATAADIQQIYADLFGRTAEKSGLDYWQNLAQQQNADALALRDQIGRAGMAPGATEAAQRLIDTGESQYLGPGTEWSAPQPPPIGSISDQPVPFTNFLTQNAQDNLGDVNLPQSPLQDSTVYAGGSNTFNEFAPVDETTGTSQVFNPSNLGFADLSINQIQNPNINQVYTDLNQPSIQNSAINIAQQQTSPSQQPIGSADIQNLYANLFGRTGEQSGVDYWLNKANQGLSLSDITNQMSEAGKDPALQAIAQQLVDTGQSQYLGGGSIWNPTQPGQYYSYGGRVSPLSRLAFRR